MNMTKTFLATALTLPLMFGNAAFAGEDHGKGDRDGRHHAGKQCGERAIMQQLDLSEQQLEQLKAQRESAREQMKKAFAEQGEQHKAKREAQHKAKQALVLAEDFDKAAAQKLAANMAEQHAAMMVHQLEREHAKLAVLTAEQKEQYAKLKAKGGKDCREDKPRRGHKGE
ncbi:Spy/CpxP family protein refolding chaperone [Marinomonas ostreistagni]|uniref:Spy/CpxP family protein refolding chaperone n=1 Tax=Marinomonas ostreistagni TaxID=359209 RepID=UPI00194F0CF5|nr:Spy/CpxP family protein refolding chaperone [Marinomonas ostreistagni]MBM6550055.1 Spy/CpxP family protein refolding chaperone [Marinomonas ostreistagni]